MSDEHRVGRRSAALASAVLAQAVMSSTTASAASSVTPAQVLRALTTCFEQGSLGGMLAGQAVQATNATVAAKLGDRFSRAMDVVSDFGADPTGSKDCHPAFAAALSALHGGPGRIRVPNGRYLMNTTLVIAQQGVLIEGESMMSTTLVGSDTLASAIIQLGSVTTGSDLGNLFKPTHASADYGMIRNIGFSRGTAASSSHPPMGAVVFGTIRGTTLTVASVIKGSIPTSGTYEVYGSYARAGTTLTGGSGPTYALNQAGQDTAALRVNGKFAAGVFLIGCAVAIRSAYAFYTRYEHLLIQNQFIGRSLTCVSGPDTCTPFLGSIRGTTLTLDPSNTVVIHSGNVITGADLPAGTTVNIPAGSAATGSFQLSSAGSAATRTPLGASTNHEISLGSVSIDVKICNCPCAYDHLGRVADYYHLVPEYGTNGEVAGATLAQVLLTDIAQQQNWVGAKFLGGGGGAMIGGYGFRGYPSQLEADGLLRFSMPYSEASQVCFRAPAGMDNDSISQLEFDGGSINCPGGLFDLDPAIGIYALSMNGLSCGGGTTVIPPCKESRITGCFLGVLSLTGQIGTNSDGYNMVVTGNVTRGLAVSGAYAQLVLSSNIINAGNGASFVDAGTGARTYESNKMGFASIPDATFNGDGTFVIESILTGFSLGNPDMLRLMAFNADAVDPATTWNTLNIPTGGFATMDLDITARDTGGTQSIFIQRYQDVPVQNIGKTVSFLDAAPAPVFSRSHGSGSAVTVSLSPDNTVGGINATMRFRDGGHWRVVAKATIKGVTD